MHKERNITRNTAIMEKEKSCVEILLLISFKKMIRV